MPKHPKVNKVYISIQGGNVQTVYASNPNTVVTVIDWDNAEVSEDCETEAKALLAEAQRIGEPIRF
jgi:hypothetical protein